LRLDDVPFPVSSDMTIGVCAGRSEMDAKRACVNVWQVRISL